MEKKRAKIEILNSIINFGTTISVNGKSESIFNDDKYAFHYQEISGVQLGDLVKIQAAPFTKWYLSWVVEIRNKSNFTEYLLESIEDGKLCWWSNISLCYLNRKTILSRPDFRYSDEQFDFVDKCRSAYRESVSLYCFAGCDFNEDGSVNVLRRERFQDYSGEFIKIKNWKKVSEKYITNFFNKKPNGK